MSSRREASAIDRAPNAHPQPIIGGTHIAGRDLVGPGARGGRNLPGTCAAVVRPPALEPVLDGETPLVVLELPDTLLTAIARAVHLGAGIDGYRLFARLANGDVEARRRLLADVNVREALTLTLTPREAGQFVRDLDVAVTDAEAMADAALAALAEPNPDDARDNSLADELFGMGEHPAGVER